MTRSTPPETLRHVAIVSAMPLYSVSRWLAAVKQQAGIKFDRYSFRINPMRLHAFIDGMDEPRLAITFYDGMDTVANKLKDADLARLIVLRDITL